jgi:hypothetical protein
MFNFKSTTMTKTAANIIGAVYIAYAIFMVGIPGLLMSLAIGLIVMGINGSMELAVATAVLVGLLMKFVFKYRSDGFMNFTANEVTQRIQNMQTAGKVPAAPTGSEGFQTMSPAEVVQRVAGMRGASRLQSPPVGYDGRMGPQGVMASNFAEGFANPDANTDATNSSSAPSDSSPATPSSTTAPADATSVSAAAPNAQPTKPTTSGFQGGKNDGLFKLGEMPSESAGGPHIDAGSTILNAIQNLNPGQLKNMTDDTRKLLDTQKSLLSMLETMKPMISDGSQLLNSFNTMFGKDGGGLAGALKLGA